VILIDTDILIWVLRNNDEYKKKFITATDVSKGKLFITPIQHLEIMSGIREKELINTELFLDSVQTVIVNKEI
jgi:predicted nucleic acid-binding protein